MGPDLYIYMSYIYAHASILIKSLYYYYDFFHQFYVHDTFLAELSLCLLILNLHLNSSWLYNEDPEFNGQKKELCSLNKSKVRRGRK